MSKYLSITAKCSDRCGGSYPGGTEIEGYVPKGIGIGGGDYVELTIDIETGVIQDWPGAAAILEAEECAAEEQRRRDFDRKRAGRGRW